MIKKTDLIILEKVAEKVYNQLAEEKSVNSMLVEKSILGILGEQLEQDEVESITKLSQDAKADMESLIGELEPLGFDNTIEYMQGLADEIPDNLDAASIILRDDPKETAEEVGKVVAATKKTNAVRDSVTDALVKVLGALDKIDGIENQDKEQFLSSLAGAGGFPTEDDLRKGAESAFVPPEEEKGVFAKIASFFGFGGNDLTPKEFSDDFLGAKLGDLEGKRDDFAAIQSSNQKDTEASDKLADETQSDVEALSKGDTSVLPPAEGSAEKSEDSGSGEGGSAQSKKEQEETDQAAEQSAAAAAEAAESADLSPSQGAADIIDKWATAGKTLSRNVSKKQRSALGSSLSNVFNKTAETLASNIEKAVDSWRESQRVLQSPNVSDLQINILKKNLASFVSGVITTESIRSNRSGAKNEIASKMKMFLIENTDMHVHQVQTLSNNELFEEFVFAFCDNFEIKDTSEKVLTESAKSYGESDMLNYRLQKLAGLN